MNTMKSSKLNIIAALVAASTFASLALLPAQLAFGALLVAASALILLVAINDYAPSRELTPASPALAPKSANLHSLSRVRLAV